MYHTLCASWKRRRPSLRFISVMRRGLMERCMEGIAMSPGPKFKITLDTAVANIQTVATRLGIQRISSRCYTREGSFNTRTLERKWGWALLVKLAGLQSGSTGGRPRRIRKLCLQQCGRTNYANLSHCRTCWRRIQRQESEIRTDFTSAPFA